MSTKHLIHVLFVLGASVCTTAWAQQPADDLGPELRDRTRDALDQPLTRPPLPDGRSTAEQAERTRRALEQAPRGGMPEVSVTRRQQLDLNELLRAAPKVESEHTSGPVVFVSLSMPQGSLLRLAHDAQKIGGVLVMRGTVNGSLKQTVAAVQRLSAQGVEVQIDPQAFTRYGVSVVPSVVLDLGGVSGCDTSRSCRDRSALIEGDVTLRHSLEHMARTASSQRVRAQAREWVASLDGGAP